jgi:hypothetical protein
VARDPRWVRVVREGLAGYAADLPLEQVPTQLDPEFHYHGEEDATAAFVVTLDAINFGSGYFPQLRRRDGRSGYFHVARALTERFRDRGPYTAAELEQLTPDACAGVFEQVLEGPAGELMTLFAGALNALGRALRERWGGSFRALIEAAGGSAERLAGLLADVPYYDDVHPYRDFQVPIYKRAQITPSDLSLALRGEGLGRFHDLDRLTIFADNLVPHVLRLDGVLAFDAVLLERIEREELLVSGSEEEVEMRACAIHAVELIGAELRRLGLPGRSMGLDNLLWNRGQGPQYKARPRPRCRSIYY